MPRPFDGYIEHPARVSSTSLISFQTQPLQRAMRMGQRDGERAGVSRPLDGGLAIDGDIHSELMSACLMSGHVRPFTTGTHYIALIAAQAWCLAQRGTVCRRCPSRCGSLRQGSVADATPVAIGSWRRCSTCGDLKHGLEAVLVAAGAGLAVRAGSVPSMSLNVLSRLKEQTRSSEPRSDTHLNLSEARHRPMSDRYDRLRSQQMERDRRSVMT